MPDLSRIIVDPAHLGKLVAKAAAYLDDTFKGEALTLVGILRGGAPFTCDLARYMVHPVFVEWMCLSSYEGTESTGKVKTLLIPDQEFIEGRHVVLVDDIVDTGRSAREAIDIVTIMDPKSVCMVSVLDKPGRRVYQIPELRMGMVKVKSDCFAVGYGMDYNGRFRDMPLIAEYAPHDGEPPAEDEDEPSWPPQVANSKATS